MMISLKFLQPSLIHEGRGLLTVNWCPPPVEFWKLNIDGSFSEDNGVMGGGDSICDNSGKWTMGFMSHSRGGNLFLAEARALRDGLKLAWDQGVRRLVCDSDCRELVSVMTDFNRAFTHVHAPVLLEIRSLLSRNWRVNLCWCGREANYVADWLAKRGTHASFRSSAGITMVVVPSPKLEVLLLRDSLGVG